MFKSMTLALVINLGLVGLAHSADKYVVWYALSSSGETKELNISKVFAVPEELNEEDISNMYKKYLTNKGKEANFPNRNIKTFSSQAEAIKFKDSYLKQYELIDTIKVVEDTVKEEGKSSQAAFKKVTWPLNTQEAQDYQKEQAVKYKMELKKTVSMGTYCGKDTVFVFIPPGEYTMGSPASEEGRNSDEAQRRVIVKEPFYMQESECETPLSFASEIPTILQNMNKYAPDGFIFRLPSEAEWEYAARAGRTTAYLYGNESMGVSFSDATKSYTAPLPLAKNFKPNSWGLYDVLGRKAELVRGVYYEPKPSDIAVDSKEYNKVGNGLLLRGGASWLGEKQNRLASRLMYPFGGFFALDDTVGSKYRDYKKDSPLIFEKNPVYAFRYVSDTPSYHMVGMRLVMEILN